MLTLFAIPKDFRGHIGVIQRNAIQSWQHLQPPCEVILFGDEAGTAQVASEFHVRHVPAVERNPYGTPLVDSLFASAGRLASHPWLCYVNTDIILMADFLEAVQRVIALGGRGLMICRRWDVTLTEPLNFYPGWERDMRTRVIREGRRRPHTAIDCFAFPRGLWGDIPPFALGRGMWDNWLIYGARASGFPVIDLSGVVVAVHQNHDYAHQVHTIKTENDVWSTEEAKRNLTLGGGFAHAFSAYDATHVLTQRGLRRNVTPYSLYRALAMLSVSWPPLVPVVRFIRFVSKEFTAMRNAALGRLKR